MENEFQFLDIFILALITGYLIYKLYSILGQEDSDDLSKRRAFRERTAEAGLEADAGGNVIEGKFTKKPPDSVLRAIYDADPSFDIHGFIMGARQAFSLILESYAAGDTEKLSTLLDTSVFKAFEKAIKKRNKEKLDYTSTLMRVRDVEIVGAKSRGIILKITLKFLSEQIIYVKDANGNVVEGDTNQVEEVTDIWTFARDVTAQDPNWILVATESQE